MTKGQDLQAHPSKQFLPESLETLFARSCLQIPIFPSYGYMVPFSWHHSIGEWWNLRCVGPAWSPTVAEWNWAKLEPIPWGKPHPCTFWDVFWLSSSLVLHLLFIMIRACLNRTRGRCSFHSYNGRCKKPMPMSFQLSCRGSEKWNNLSRR